MLSILKNITIISNLKKKKTIRLSSQFLRGRSLRSALGAEGSGFHMATVQVVTGPWSRLTLPGEGSAFTLTWEIGKNTAPYGCRTVALIFFAGY